MASKCIFLELTSLFALCFCVVVASSLVLLSSLLYYKKRRKGLIRWQDTWTGLENKGVMCASDISTSKVNFDSNGLGIQQSLLNLKIGDSGADPTTRNGSWLRSVEDQQLISLLQPKKSLDETITQRRGVRGKFILTPPRLKVSSNHSISNHSINNDCSFTSDSLAPSCSNSNSNSNASSSSCYYGDVLSLMNGLSFDEQTGRATPSGSSQDLIARDHHNSRAPSGYIPHTRFRNSKFVQVQCSKRDSAKKKGATEQKTSCRLNLLGMVLVASLTFNIIIIITYLFMI